MPDYMAMYYHLAGRMAIASEAPDATTGALVVITEELEDGVADHRRYVCKQRG